MFPAFQYTDSVQVRPEMMRLLAILPTDRSRLRSDFWLYLPHGWLGGVRPVDAFANNPAAVVDAGRSTYNPDDTNWVIPMTEFTDHLGPHDLLSWSLVRDSRDEMHTAIRVWLHPHMLRHSTGHILADAGADMRLLQDWLGHRDIRHTALYSRTASKRFEGVWRQ